MDLKTEAQEKQLQKRRSTLLLNLSTTENDGENKKPTRVKSLHSKAIKLFTQYILSVNQDSQIEKLPCPKKRTKNEATQLQKLESLFLKKSTTIKTGAGGERKFSFFKIIEPKLTKTSSNFGGNPGNSEDTQNASIPISGGFKNPWFAKRRKTQAVNNHILNLQNQNYNHRESLSIPPSQKITTPVRSANSTQLKLSPRQSFNSIHTNEDFESQANLNIDPPDFIQNKFANEAKPEVKKHSNVALKIFEQLFELNPARGKQNRLGDKEEQQNRKARSPLSQFAKEKTAEITPKPLLFLKQNCEGEKKEKEIKERQAVKKSKSSTLLQNNMSKKLSGFGNLFDKDPVSQFTIKSSIPQHKETYKVRITNTDKAAEEQKNEDIGLLSDGGLSTEEEKTKHLLLKSASLPPTPKKYNHSNQDNISKYHAFLSNLKPVKTHHR